MRIRIHTLRLALTRVMAAAALTIATGAIVATPTASHAASSCGAGPTITDRFGIKRSTRICPTWTATNVWEWDDGWNAFYTGYLYAGNNWVVCQEKPLFGTGPENPTFGKGYRNTYWLYTQGDELRGPAYFKGWGWIPATAVSYGENNKPVPGVPLC